MQVESLESRRLLSVSVVENVLTVQTTSGRDVVLVNVAANGDFVVRENNSTKTVASDGVTGLRIDLFGGADSLNISRSVTLAATVYGGAGDDTLLGGGGSDYLHGGADDDSLSGRQGNDTLVGANGGDDFSGGDGFDTVSYAGIALPVTVTLDGDGNDGIQDENDNIHESVEAVVGGRANDHLEAADFSVFFDGRQGNDTLLGGDGNDTLIGDSGNDSLVGGDGKDSLVGNDGDDYFDPGYGDDVANGGGGRDVIDYHTRTNGINYAGGRMISEGKDGDTDRLYNMNVLYGSKADDVLINTAGDTVVDIHGGAGNDHIEITVAGISVSPNAAYARGEDGNDTLAISWVSATNRNSPGTAFYYGGRGDDTFDVDRTIVHRNVDGNLGHDILRYHLFTKVPTDDVVRLVEHVTLEPV